MGNYSNDTPFVEAQLMLAALRDDTDEVGRLVAGMLTGELEDIDTALTSISHAITEEFRRRRIAGQTP